MKTEHPNLVISTPAPGHFVVSGHNPSSVFIEGEGHVVPMSTCYITPEIPTDVLLRIAATRAEEGSSLSDAITRAIEVLEDADAGDVVTKKKKKKEVA